MPRRTHYDVLGVARDASSVDIASAFRDRLAQIKAKPDVAQDYVDSVREAYQILATPERRTEYDGTLEAEVPARRARPEREPRAVAEAPAWRSAAVRFGVPLALAIVAVAGWKMRQKAAVPQSEVVATAEIEPAAPPPPPSGGSERVPLAVAPGADARAPMTAEQIFARVSPSIVRVYAGDARGSGVVVGPGSVITNCHVANGGGNVTVKSGDALLPASVTTADEVYDLCALSVAGLDAPPVSIGTVAGVRTGQRVYAIGSPFGLELTISEGIVSSLRELDQGRVIQTTAAVSPGSSGGGLFATDGQLVGIVTFQHRLGQNLNFAVPADWIAEMRTRSGGGFAGRASSPPSPVHVPVASAEPTAAEMVVGSWHCFGALTGRNGTYAYGADGILRVSAADGRNFATPYRVVGRSIRYATQGQAFTLDIESISSDRMVQFVEAGQRLACERNS